LEATLKQGFYPPHPIFAMSQGSTQILPNGNALVNWGSANQVTEFNSAGEVLFHAYIESGIRQQNTQNYRAFRGNWTGYSPESLAVTAEKDEKGTVSAWVSWNGDTRTAVWRFWHDASSVRGQAFSSEDVPKTGFETRYEVSRAMQGGKIYVEAIDEQGNVLQRSSTLLLMRSGAAVMESPDLHPASYPKAIQNVLS
jgi:hypothetical protein